MLGALAVSPVLRAAHAPKLRVDPPQMSPLLVAHFSHLTTAHAKQHRPAAETTVGSSKALLAWENINRCSKLLGLLQSSARDSAGTQALHKAASWSRAPPTDGESSEPAATNTQSKGGEMSKFNFIQSVRKEIKWEHDNTINTSGENAIKGEKGII